MLTSGDYKKDEVEFHEYSAQPYERAIEFKYHKLVSHNGKQRREIKRRRKEYFKGGRIGHVSNQ